MKKINVVLLSILTMLLSGVLMACTFKKPEVNFLSEEKILSLSKLEEKSVDLKDLIEVVGIEKSEVEFRFSNPALFEIEGSVITAVESGRSFVYATYQNNSFDSMQLIVKKPFDAPQSFSMSETALLSWGAVSGTFETGKGTINAETYNLSGTYTAENGTVSPFNVKNLSRTSYQLTEKGKYELSVYANGVGYFDDGARATQTFYVGYMPLLKQTDFTWADGVLSWSSIENAKYQVEFDGAVIGDFQTETSIDLSDRLDAVSAGVHTVSVTVADVSTAEDRKLNQKSEVLTIRKLATPTAQLSDGQIVLPNQSNVEEFDIVLTAKDDETDKVALNGENGASTSLNELDELRKTNTVFNLAVVAKHESDEGGFFYHSNAQNLGYICKLSTPTLTGTGDNSFNGTLFNAKVQTAQVPTDTTLEIYGLSTSTTLDGVSAGENLKEFSLTVSEVGVYTLSAVQKASAQNYVDDGTPVYVLNSNISDSLTMTKLAQVQGEITHQYVENKSTFTFQSVENATKYQLQRWTGSTFDVEKEIDATESQTQTIVLQDKIENLFEVIDGKYSFQIVAKTEDDTLAIGSSTEKVLQSLGTAQSQENSREDTNKTYSWGEVSNADSYLLKIFALTKEEYDNQSMNAGTSQTEEVGTDSTQYTFAEEGYYCVQVYAISGDENAFISSVDCLKEFVLFAEQTELGDAQFGFDASLPNEEGLTDAGGYFVKIAPTENVTNYKLYVDKGLASEKLYTFSATGTNDAKTYLLMEDFASGSHTLSLTGYGDDDAVYLPTSAYNLTVERLTGVTTSDFNTGKLLVNDFKASQSVTVKTKEGARSVIVNVSDGSSKSNEGDVTIDTSNLSNFNLKIDFAGSRFDSITHTYTVTDGKVYLDAETSTVDFSRLDAPTGLQYYDGALNFTHTQIADKAYYVVDISCTTASNEKFSFSIRFDNIVTAVYGSLNVPLGAQSDYVTVTNGNDVAIDIGKVIAFLKTNETLASIYNQAKEINFAVYAYQTRVVGDKFILSSGYASTLADASKTSISVPKLESTNLTFSYNATENILSWDAVTTDASVSAETKYEVYVDGETNPLASTTATTYTFDSSLIGKTFYVKATNPYYLESSNSNNVTVHKLSKLTSISLTDGGKFAFRVSANDADACTSAKLSIDGGEATTISLTNGVGEIEIRQRGTYSITLVGTTARESAGVYYIDSDVSTWTVKNLSDVAPESLEVTIENNQISWNGLGSLDALEYVLIFKDEENGTGVFKTTFTAVNWLTNDTLRESLENLASGNILLGLSAHIKAHSVVAGGTIYFGEETTLLNGSVEFNHIKYETTSVTYGTQTIKKLTTPQIVNVEFENVSEQDYTQTPNIKVTISGNYGTNGAFQIYRKGNNTPIKTLTITANNGNYEFTLTAGDYNNYVSAGEELVFEIYAINQGENVEAISSSKRELKFTRADNLSSIGFIEDDFGFSKVVEITLPSENVEQILGGIVLKFTFDDGTATTTEYALVNTTGAVVDENEQNYVVTYDASALIEQYLSTGGTVKVEAFVQSDSSETYILASNTIATTDHSVLKSLSTSDIQRKDYGFEISNVNGENCVYVVDYGGQLFEVSKESEFAFEVPNDWDEKFNPYNLTIYATESGKISSKGLTYAFNLDRIEAVQEVTISRTGNNPATISWDAVTGASGYILKVYSRLTDDAKGSLLTEVEGTATSYTFEQLFGAGYENLLGSGKLSLSDLESGCDIWIELITKGGESKNNSKALDVRANIVGNPLTAENVVTNEFGNLTLVEGDGQTFLDRAFIYRFVSGSGELLYSSEGELLSVWTLCEDNLLDTTMLESDGSAFNVEIIFLGSLQASSSDSSFELDSMNFSSVNLSLTFYKMENISNIAVDSSLGGSLAITLPTDNFSNIYVGFTPDAILKGELDGTDGVVAIETTFVGKGTENDEFVYSYKLADLISIMSSAGLDYGENSIYFWLCREGEAPYYVASDAYQFTFNLTEDPQFSEIVKGTYTAVSGDDIEDYINTFAVFENNDTITDFTLGIFVKVTWEKDGETAELTQFVTADALTKYVDRFAGYAINLTEIFETDTLIDLSGTFTVDFARASLNNLVYTMSNWLSATNGVMEFERLDKTSSVSVRNGNVSWTESGERATKYCIYFYTNVEAKIYTTLYTTLTTLNVSEFVGSEDAYYIAVQAINEDDSHVLSSRQTFKLGADDKPQSIYKNQIRSPLTLVDGKLLINWTTGDTDSNFYDMLMQTTGNYAELARNLVTTTFTSPFTFTLTDLVNGNIYLRLRFSSTEASGMTKTFDVNAINFLADLAEFGSGGALSRLSVLYNAEENPTYKNLISEFRKAITESSYGVANPNAIFDKYFEALQIGAYSLEYCLTTSSATLNSQWYSFENENGENLIYINEEPTVNARIVTSQAESIEINQFKVIIKKSEIWDYDGGEYVKKTAENYVMKLGTQSFAIYLAGSQYKLSLLSGDTSKTVSVYECDATGAPIANGEYLMFYLNYNDGNSLQGIFNLDVQGTQEMQIYAVGNNFSVSSKSECFNVTFLNFGTFGVTDGVFNWTTYLNRNTSVFVKRSTDLNYALADTIDGSRVTASYGLEGYTGGTYSLKFIIEGEVRGNVIIVDSEILFVENAYKLSAPILSNVNGYLGFDLVSSGGVNTEQQLNNSYSDADLYRYLVYNDNSGSQLSTKVSDTRADKSATFLYEAGITDLSESEPYYAYKRTEEFATNFYASMLGSTATLSCEKDVNKYYLRNVKCLDLSDQLSVLHIAIRSENASLEASMLDAVNNTIRIENGVVVWDEVTGKYEWNSATSTYETLGVESGAQIVYKVTISKYKKSATASGTVDTNITEDVSYYTLNTHFDLSVLGKTDVDDDDVYIKVKIQALALFISETQPASKHVELVEGGYGYGNVKFDETNRFVLMGNGAEIKDITRLKNVYGLRVVDGKLGWCFDCPNSLTTSNFLDYYTFLVVDDEGQEISGSYALSQEGSKFDVIFTEDEGQLKSGTYDVSVYVLTGRLNRDLSIKSFAEVLNITKLESITSNDYEIISSIESDDEILSLEKYFAIDANADNIVLATINIGEDTFDFNFTQTAYKLHILREDDDEFVVDRDAVGYVVIGGGTAGVTFRVINSTDINSDASQEFSLHRVDWQDYSISWDSEVQQFVWDYDLHSLSSEVSAQKMRYAYILKTDATLYGDADMTDEREMLASGVEVQMLEEGEGSSKILYESEEYYISTTTYERQILEVTEGETVETLQTSQLFQIIEEEGEYSIVDVEGELYKISTSFIVNPIFIVEATITKLDGTTQERTYETTQKYFKPTVIGSIKIAVRIKINALNLLSNKLESEEETFDLFVSGDGTSSSPYVIASVTEGEEKTAAEVFQNLSYRMTKDSALMQYVCDGEIVTEEDKFYFQLQEDIDLGSFDGILFDGEFGGVIDGGDYTITYTSTGVEQLSSNVVIGENETTMYVQSGNFTLTYSRGSALFDTLTSSAKIKNLKLDVKYGEDTFYAIYFHSLVAGLAVRNNGTVESVTVVGFENYFYGAMMDRLAVAYSGIVAINEATGYVLSCTTTANMEINDNTYMQLISLSGIAYTNRGIIDNCVAGSAESIMTVNSQHYLASLQVSGIATTNTSSGTIRNCTNNYRFEVWGTTDSRATCYIGGIVVLGKGTLSNNVNNGSYSTVNIPNMPANYGEIYVKQS